MEYALEVRNLRKDYKTFSLKDVSFALPRGTIMGLVGPNGAGKTTVIKLILNLTRRKAGEVRVFGEDLMAREKEIKSRLGFVHEVPALVEDATLRDLAAAVAPLYEKWDGALFRSLISEFGLPLGKKFKKLSHGMKMKFSLALALSHDADLLVLDEPTSGLDPVFRRELLERLSDLIQDERKAVLFSTHITSDLETTADYITLLNAGKVVFSLPKDEIRETWAVVKGGSELLNGKLRPLFRAIRETPHYVEALTSDLRSSRSELPPGAVIEKASLEDIMVFMNEGAAHA
jgi:ABC-2 type transport system ATP-binding protein